MTQFRSISDLPWLLTRDEVAEILRDFDNADAVMALKTRLVEQERQIENIRTTCVSAINAFNEGANAEALVSFIRDIVSNARR